MVKNKTLFLFTGGFPFGNKIETFLETEINYLAKEFDTVYIFPKTKEKAKRNTPVNVILLEDYFSLKLSKFDKLFCLIKNVNLVVRVLKSEIKDKSFKKVIKNRRVVFDYLSQQILTYDSLKKYDFSSSIIYDYWFSNFTLALSFIKSKNPKVRFVARGHGFDIYDERNREYGVPFRAWKVKYIDELSIISKFGQQYTKEKVSSVYRNKITVNYLGVKKPVISKTNNNLDEIKYIVSCSSILGFKNVHRIACVLKHCKSKIKWIHFGSGPYEKNVLENVEKLGSNISFELMGHVDNSIVQEFYKNQNIDLFISLSESEGLPVSMMEALGFGIPIVALPVGGIPELVINGLTGKLLNLSQNNEEIAKEIDNQLIHNFSKEDIIDFFDKNFNSDNNYPKFINEALCLGN